MTIQNVNNNPGDKSDNQTDSPQSDKDNIQVEDQAKPSEGTQNTEDQDTQPELTQEQWEVAYGSKRFKELAESKKELDTLRAKQEKQENEKLKKDKQFEELIQKQEVKIKTLEEEKVTSSKKEQVLAIARTQGFRNPSTAIKLIDLGSLEIDDTGKVTNAEEKLKSLAESDSYLVGGESTTPSNVGTGTNPSQQEGDKKVWKLSELKDKLRSHEWYKENKEEVNSAYAENRVVDDVHTR